jgi:hypothetical protein
MPREVAAPCGGVAAETSRWYDVAAQRSAVSLSVNRAAESKLGWDCAESLGIVPATWIGSPTPGCIDVLSFA